MLNNIGLPGLFLIAVVTLVLFGKGKVSSLMGEMGKGISAFKAGLRDGETDAPAPTPAPMVALPDTRADGAHPSS